VDENVDFLYKALGFISKDFGRLESMSQQAKVQVDSVHICTAILHVHQNVGGAPSALSASCD